ncbi:MAG: hypothetical protein PHD43_10680 [Methylococcales bacterium]|nr:hypothetical protein [Methylococcales bacterium]
MDDLYDKNFDHMLSRWFYFSMRHAVLVIVLSILAAAGALYYTINNLRINIYPGNVLPDQLPLRQDKLAYERAFPQFRDSIVIVLDVPTMVHRFPTATPKDGILLHISTALAVVLSALSNISSFGNLSISPHHGMASIGIMLRVGIRATRVCSMVVPPALLDQVEHLDPRPNRREPEAATGKALCRLP